MKRIVDVFCLFFGIIFLTIYHPPATAQTIDEITQSIHTGSSKALGKSMQDNITLNINNTLSDYSKNQAEQILRDFFRKNPPKELKVLHRDESADKAWYIIGQYRSEEANFKVLVKGIRQEGRLIISSMEFTKE